MRNSTRQQYCTRFTHQATHIRRSNCHIILILDTIFHAHCNAVVLQVNWLMVCSNRIKCDATRCVKNCISIVGFSFRTCSVLSNAEDC